MLKRELPGGNDGKRSRVGGCPICGKQEVLIYRPFCSKRCSRVDLGKWLNGAYWISGSPTTLDEEQE